MPGLTRAIHVFADFLYLPANIPCKRAADGIDSRIEAAAHSILRVGRGAKTMRTANQKLADHVQPLELASQLEQQYVGCTSASYRKSKGQFFTPGTVCRFMASLFASFPKELKVLDPGAGVGSLSAAVCGRVLRGHTPRRVELHLYENDTRLVPFLKRNMDHCRQLLEQAGHQMVFVIHEQDFILANSHRCGAASLFHNTKTDERFDIAILNPPYSKIAGASLYADLLRSIVHGQPNIYVLFMALAGNMLRPGGELVAITPRSFCSGLYFRQFRRWFLERASLRHIHLFDSRRDTFADVLQENVITVWRRAVRARKMVAITTSSGTLIPLGIPRRRVPLSIVLDRHQEEMVIRIPATSVDEEIVNLVESWPARLSDLGLRVSTGPVVRFRARRFLLPKVSGSRAAPLILVNNVRPFRTDWPLELRGKPTALRVCRASKRLLVPTRNYVFLRRFSAKEEHRRLTASCFLKSSFHWPYVALENHLNYVYHGSRELTGNETFGLAAVFNSALLDKYFRTLSGNTQVNASQVRMLPLPDLETIARIGQRVARLPDLGPTSAEAVVLEELGIDGNILRHLRGISTCARSTKPAIS